MTQIQLNRAQYRHQRPIQTKPPAEHKHSITRSSNTTEFDLTAAGFHIFIYAMFHCKMVKYAHSFTYNNTTKSYGSSQVFKHNSCLVLEASLQCLKLDNELLKCIHQQIFTITDILNI